MKTIELRLAGDVVYFITGSGFKKGSIKTARVNSEKKGCVEITYMVKEQGDDSPFMGYEKKPGELWDSYKDMIDHFTNQKL
jgi:hypothetical protein